MANVHRLVGGQTPEVGLRVFTNNLDRGRIVEVADGATCGPYCEAWHKVEIDIDYKGQPISPPRRQIMNCSRLTTTWNGRRA